MEPSEATPLIGGDQRSPRKLSSLSKTFGNIVISIVGAGVLGLPYAFKRSGWLVGLVSVVVAGAVTYYCMMLLVASARKLRPDCSVHTMGELGYQAMGLPGQVWTDSMALISQFGCCVAYLIFIAENLGTIFHSSRTSTIFLLIPFQVLLSWIRSLTGLAPFSIAADLAMAAAIAFVMGNDVASGFGAIDQVKPYTTFKNATFVVSVAIYCFEGFAVTQPLEASMKKPSKFGKILGLALALITVVYSAFGLFGYLAYGDKTLDIVTLNMDTGWCTLGVKIGLCVGLFFTFPVMMVPVYDVLDRTLTRRRWFQLYVDPSPRLRKGVFRAVRTLVVLLAAYVATSVPSFGDFIALIGSTVCAMLAFVLPALFHLRLSQADIRWWEYLIDVFLIAFGGVFAVAGTWDTLRTALHFG